LKPLPLDEEESQKEVVFQTNVDLRKLNGKELHNSQLSRYEIDRDSIKEDEKERPPETTIKGKDTFPETSTFREKEGSEDRLNEEVEEEIQSKESNISKILSDDTIKRIIIVILMLMVSIPLMDIGNYVTLTTQWDFMTSFTLKAMY
jgi:hypothetical protein